MGFNYNKAEPVYDEYLTTAQKPHLNLYFVELCKHFDEKRLHFISNDCTDIMIENVRF